ncbi:unnamed protein product [Larinioides sclopetarius]|uniref:Uncharacterized protein n=1 Tax=Larinioides sclopetarius TaxID=280406 RepID=A0AAV2AFA3_9ARAC
MCCAKAIYYALAHLENDRLAINAMRNRRRSALSKRPKKLHHEAGVPVGPCTYTEISIYEEFLNVQVVVISPENLNKVSYRGKDRSRCINLFLHNEHYDVIKSLKGFYGTNHYCKACDTPYMNIEDHRCANA